MGRKLVLSLCIFPFSVVAALAQQPRLTIYNQDFAVVRVRTTLDLKQGINHVQLSDVTNYLEPDSVILRDPSGQYPLRILEQNYRADPVSQQSMLQLYEGKQINFLVTVNGHTEVVSGKIIRSGYAPPSQPTYPYYSRPYGAQQIPPAMRQPVIEVDGQLRFSLPGEPLFPALTEGSILKPILSWVIESQKAGRVDAQFSYITSEMGWDATYNLTEPPAGQTLNLVGWVTMHNRSGMTFKDAQVDLMAGTIHKLPPEGYGGGIGGSIQLRAGIFLSGAPQVTEQPFDEYHLYTLHRPITLHDQETKQVEFIRANGIKVNLYYVYDGLNLPANQYNGWSIDMIRQNREFGTEFTRQVRVYRSFDDTEANHLGIPLPAGRLRFYREGEGGNLQFLGEAPIEHTPENETVRAYTGNAFDLLGERLRTNYVMDSMRNTLDESFKIRLNNHKKQAAEIRVDEHLYRGYTWEILQHSDPFVKVDSQAIEFRVEVPADGEKTVTYTVHYTW
jgi:hypothetical protein